jgi:hypothetical protein
MQVVEMVVVHVGNADEDNFDSFGIIIIIIIIICLLINCFAVKTELYNCSYVMN